MRKDAESCFKSAVYVESERGAFRHGIATPTSQNAILTHCAETALDYLKLHSILQQTS